MAYRNKMISNPVSGQTICFLQTSADTKGKLLEMESTFAPFSKEPPAHLHPKQEEDFEVLEGVLTVRMDGVIKILHPGDRLHIPANSIHSMWNNSEEKAVVNWKVQPALDTEYFLETGMGLAASGRVNNEGMPCLLQGALLVRKYNEVFRLAKPSYPVQKMVFGILTPFSRLAGNKSVYPEYLN